MELLFVFLVVKYLTPTVLSCSSSTIEKVVPEVIPSVFSFLKSNDAGLENRTARRSFISANKYTNLSNTCHNLLPAAESIVHGVNVYYFGMNSSDRQPTTSPWTYLHCPPGAIRVDRGYDKPIQFESQIIYPSHVYQETVKESELFAKEILMFVPEIYKIGVFTVHFGAVEAYQLATLSNEQLKTTVTYHMEDYKVKLFGGLIPTNHFLEFWYSLPEVYNSTTELMYHSFINEFGTHIFIEGTFGGRLFLSVTRSNNRQVIRMNDHTPVPPGTYPMEILLRTNPHFSENITERVYISQGGIFRPDKTIGDWAETVTKKPTITRGTKVPISEIVHGDENKKNAFNNAVRAEADHHTLRRSMTIIDVGQPHSELKTLS